MRPMPLLPPVTTATRPLTLNRSKVLREVIFIKDNVSVDIEQFFELLIYLFVVIKVGLYLAI
jgi:hypothetical protein